jgi:hypothetical protein
VFDATCVLSNIIADFIDLRAVKAVVSFDFIAVLIASITDSCKLINLI